MLVRKAILSAHHPSSALHLSLFLFLIRLLFLHAASTSAFVCVCLCVPVCCLCLCESVCVCPPAKKFQLRFDRGGGVPVGFAVVFVDHIRVRKMMIVLCGVHPCIYVHCVCAYSYKSICTCEHYRLGIFIHVYAETPICIHSCIAFVRKYMY